MRFLNGHFFKTLHTVSTTAVHVGKLYLYYLSKNTSCAKMATSSKMFCLITLQDPAEFIMNFTIRKEFNHIFISMHKEGKRTPHHGRIRKSNNVHKMLSVKFFIWSFRFSPLQNHCKIERFEDPAPVDLLGHNYCLVPEPAAVAVALNQAVDSLTENIVLFIFFILQMFQVL